ncbi:hypothetical protein [Candidatus Uabimicrobium amorphum]|uniref:Uncharacterized protein n=1 Tax=Uabimicrobium amorphum TaxID=2596890 RepID=A0A5S9IN62_UABAM|nr:hypothetical protein [Candidatus Uabimicrobium amorphum]BBM84506.1 hypothetical protein UABAM_02867 [Candidatus Uabimicrobium amorphum]
MKPIIIFAILFSLVRCEELSSPDAILFQIRHKNYMEVFWELKKNEERYLKSQYKRSYLSNISMLYSWMGKYKKSIEIHDSRYDTVKKKTSLKCEEYKAQDAVTTILKLSEKQQAIFVNEAHHVPMHRAFSILLLHELYQKGFRYFAAETLTPGASMSKYPTKRTGYYTQEPVYADLVRIAIKTGYKIVAYEQSFLSEEERKKLQTLGSIERANIRDLQQAKNLAKVFEKDPQAKIFVHAGYAHINEKPGMMFADGKIQKWVVMAIQFRKLTGIDPLTISQTSMYERPQPDPNYRTAIATWNMPQPFVLQKKQHFWTRKDRYDIEVFHPQTKEKQGRPTWLLLGGIRKHVPVALPPSAAFPILVQAFYAQEQVNAIPADQILVETKQESATLCLAAGQYVVKIVDAQKILETKTISVVLSHDNQKSVK